MIGWTLVTRADLPPGGPLRSGAEAQLAPASRSVATILFRLAAEAAPLTVPRAQRIARLTADEAEDLLDRLVMEGDLVVSEEPGYYLRSGR